MNLYALNLLSQGQRWAHPPHGCFNEESSALCPAGERLLLVTDIASCTSSAVLNHCVRCTPCPQLLQYGANVHLVNTFLEVRGGTALHEAARASNAAVGQAGACALF
jgi:hypothetical protein